MIENNGHEELYGQRVDGDGVGRIERRNRVDLFHYGRVEIKGLGRRTNGDE